MNKHIKLVDELAECSGKLQGMAFVLGLFVKMQEGKKIDFMKECQEEKNRLDIRVKEVIRLMEDLIK